MALVKNINGTSDNTPPTGHCSWKDFWETCMHRPFRFCSCITCSRRAEVGGHVKLASSFGAWYIVPLCYSHNNLPSTHPYEIREADMLRIRV